MDANVNIKDAKFEPGDKPFFPSGGWISKQAIMEMISTGLTDEDLRLDDFRLTDEFCQEVVDEWIYGNLWEDEDSLSEEGIQLIRTKFPNFTE